MLHSISFTYDPPPTVRVPPGQAHDKYSHEASSIVASIEITS